MTPNEEMTAALAPIIKKMQEQGASITQLIAFQNGFTTGAMWRASHPHWISVEDELPEEGKLVLVTSHSGCFVGFYDGGWFSNGRVVQREVMVTHWMPLPQAPMKGGEE